MATSFRKGIPLLKDLPGWFFGLRYLFGYNADDRIEQELVILIKARHRAYVGGPQKKPAKPSKELLMEQRTKFQEVEKTYEEVIKGEGRVKKEQKRKEKTHERSR